MNVYLHELRAIRKSTLIWIASLCGVVAVFMAIYPAFNTDVEAVKAVLEGFPEAVRAALNLEFDTFFSVLGFYGYLLGFAILTAAIQAMNLGTAAISREDTGKTADFLLSKPVTRTTVVTAKLGAALSAIVITNVAFIAASIAAVYATASDEEVVFGTLLLMAATMFLVQLAFFALGALFSVTLPKIKSVIAVSLPTVFAFYIIGTIGDLLENEEFRFISPFRYYDPAYILKNEALETKFLVIEIAFVVLAIVATYVIYLRKDIRAAN